LAGGLLLSSVSLYSAFFTGGTGFITSFMGSLALTVATLGAPANNKYNTMDYDISTKIFKLYLHISLWTIVIGLNKVN
jgi:hypothetical protein